MNIAGARNRKTIQPNQALQRTNMLVADFERSAKNLTEFGWQIAFPKSQRYLSLMDFASSFMVTNMTLFMFTSDMKVERLF